MSYEAAREDDADWTGDLSEGEPTDDEVEVRLPAKSEYLPVLRATVGVVAGIHSFNYDEIVHLRVAVSEAFELAIGHLIAGERVPGGDIVAVRLALRRDELEILVTGPEALSGGAEGVRGEESRALLESLLDVVDFTAGPGGQQIIRMVKRKVVDEASGHQ